jgi:16S rRNA (cytidine1402-2'-O)-methyltransferase
MKMMKAKLYIVPTPIGNLKDMTFRAIEVLNEVDYILAEDTRTSGKLLKHYEIQTPARSYHMHNEHQNLKKIIEELKQGKQVALISDAGTPAISDPGFLLVRACIEHDIVVECLPGATAFVPALVCSGFPINEFLFLGFPPQKKGRKTFFEKMKEEKRAIVLYESPHRIEKTVKQLAEVLGADTLISISRELSKKFEEHLRGTSHELLVRLIEKPIKGEIVLVVDNRTN